MRATLSTIAHANNLPLTRDIKTQLVISQVSWFSSMKCSDICANSWPVCHCVGERGAVVAWPTVWRSVDSCWSGHVATTRDTTSTSTADHWGHRAVVHRQGLSSQVQRPTGDESYEQRPTQQRRQRLMSGSSDTMWWISQSIVISPKKCKKINGQWKELSKGT